MKKTSGKEYSSDEEKLEKKIKKQFAKSMVTSGMASNLKKAKKEEYTKKLGVKPQKKTMKPISKQGDVY